MPLNGQSSLLPLQGQAQELLATIDATRKVQDPIRRNLQITQIYHDLAIALADHYGSRDITWCGFAKWTSRSVGRLLRGEAFHSLLRAHVETHFRHDAAAPGLYRRFLRRLHPHIQPVVQCVRRMDEQVRKQVARGNLLVFAELAPVFAGLLALLRNSPRHDPERREAFVARLCSDPVESGGQELLVRAFRIYYDLSFERDDKRRSEQMLLANLLVASHEQARLQTVIEHASQVPTEQLALLEQHGLKRYRSLILGKLLRGRLARVLERLTRKQLMTLELPNLSVDLGEDVPPMHNGEMFPRSLRTLNDPDLQQLLEQLDRTPNTTKGSAAVNWTAIGDRMNYVTDLYRSRQQDLSLYRAPFSIGQVAAIRQGNIPGGPL